ncbi:hypothetical protein NEMBOFW57_006306 [Staphylotrichum longicolle]|uniref:Heterokaryon incompatibility domain-containing protein n=1 Tax=Staphylotrichum longicolle TaxID=669026 RepID=A0AAD4EZ57_9PEZI|nr:hypothetical protein NEMBOFW57_006306 [Staphylotrichum longicolle]
MSSTPKPEVVGTTPRTPHNRIYRPLPDGYYIRLLTLTPGQKTDPISVTLTVTDLDSAPPFEALSYVWGKIDSPADLVPITCDGHPFGVTPNLAAALRRIRGRSDTRLLWADAICINQHDLEERGFHVSFMGRIYSCAHRVLVHLGPAPDGRAGDVAALVAEVKGLLARCDGDINNAPILESSDSLLLDSRWEALKCMLSVPWFTRAWVIQEVGLARDPVVLYGDDDGGLEAESDVVEFLYRDLMRLAAWHERCAPTLSSSWGVEFSTIHGDWLDWTVSGAEAWKGDLDRTFLDLVNQASWLGCADHRDHIYSLLGHPLALVDVEENENEIGGEAGHRDSSVTGAEEKKLVVMPDYGKSVDDVYLELALNLIRQRRGLRVLSAVEHATDAELETESGSPSWVPMWKQSMTICTLGIFSGFYYNASGGLGKQPPPAVVRTSPYTVMQTHDESALREEKLLRVAGAFVDVVDETIAFNDEHLELPWTVHSPRRLADTMKSIWQAAIKTNPCPGERSPYIGDEPDSNDGRIDALSLTLTAGLTGYDSAESAEHFSEHRANFRAYRATSGLLTNVDSVVDAKDEYEHEAGTQSPEAQPAVSATTGNAEKFWLDMRLVSYGRNFFRTQRGYFGLGPRTMRRGDQCVVLAGAKVPFVLRQARGDSGTKDRRRLVGECYLHGIMNGEVTGSFGGDDGTVQIELF